MQRHRSVTEACYVGEKKRILPLRIGTEGVMLVESTRAVTWCSGV